MNGDITTVMTEDELPDMVVSEKKMKVGSDWGLQEALLGLF
jgi:hypothetical protein